VNFEKCPFVYAVTIAGVLLASESRAAEDVPEQPSHHRISMGAGGAVTYLQAGIDGHYTDSYPRGSGRFAYAYRVVRGLELGGDLAFYTSPVVLPAASVRGYIPIGAGDAVELGLSGHVGMFIYPYLSHTWLGWSAWAGPDVRVWVSDAIAVQASGEAVLGSGSTPHDHNDPAEVYISDAFFAALGGSLSIVWCP